LLIFKDKICNDQKYTQKVKWKRSTKLIFLKFSDMKWNIFYNFKVKCRRPLIVCLEVPNVYPPIVVIQIDSYSKVNKIHAAHFWMCMVATVGAFIDCEIRSDFRMGASTLEPVSMKGGTGAMHTLPHVFMGWGTILNPSSLASSLPLLLTRNTGGQREARTGGHLYSIMKTRVIWHHASKVSIISTGT
jgi:hypothetical protein